jgi:hypothetical protein
MHLTLVLDKQIITLIFKHIAKIMHRSVVCFACMLVAVVNEYTEFVE